MIGYRPAPAPRPAPSRIVAVELVTDSGARVVYPVSPPRALTGPPARIELIGGKAFLRD